MSDTPETDKAERMAFSQEYMVPTDFARKLERERDEARKEGLYYQTRYEQLKDKHDLENAKLRDIAEMLAAPHYITIPELRATKFRAALAAYNTATRCQTCDGEGYLGPNLDGDEEPCPHCHTEWDKLRDELQEQNAKLRDIAERAVSLGVEAYYAHIPELRAELDQLKEGGK